MEVNEVKRHQIQTLLSEAVTSLCKNLLSYDCELSVEGLLGITMDRRQVILVNIKQLVENACGSKANSSSASRSAEKMQKVVADAPKEASGNIDKLSDTKVDRDNNLRDRPSVNIKDEPHCDLTREESGDYRRSQSSNTNDKMHQKQYPEIQENHSARNTQEFVTDVANSKHYQNFDDASSTEQFISETERKWEREKILSDVKSDRNQSAFDLGYEAFSSKQLALRNNQLPLFDELPCQTQNGIMNMSSEWVLQSARFPCPKCARVFSHKRSLERHLKAHSMPFNRFVCTMCSSSFGRRDTLLRHMDLTHNAPRLQCPYCNKNFSRLESVQQHMMTCHPSQDGYVPPWLAYSAAADLPNFLNNIDNVGQTNSAMAEREEHESSKADTTQPCET